MIYVAGIDIGSTTSKAAIMDENNKNDDDNLAIIVTGNRHEPYFGLQRMILGQDKLVQITKEDNVVIICPPVSGTEKIATDCIDMLNQVGVKITNLSKSNLRASHADSEDLKMLYQILNPKYIIPIIGEYRHQYQQKNIAKEANYSDDRIIMLENGEQILFFNGDLDPVRDKVSVGDVLVDGLLVGDINEVVLNDRERLSQDGAVVVAVTLDTTRIKVIGEVKIKLKGFIEESNNKEIMDELYESIDNRLNEFLSTKSLNVDGFRIEFRDFIQYVIRRLTDKMPTVICSVVDVGNDIL